MRQIAEDIVSELIDDAYTIREDMQALRDRRAAVRSSLRNLRDTERVTEEQATEIDELFPPITRTRKAA